MVEMMARLSTLANGSSSQCASSKVKTAREKCNGTREWPMSISFPACEVYEGLVDFPHK